MSLMTFAILIFVVPLLAFLMDQWRDRWPVARTMSQTMIGLLAMVIGADFLLGVLGDVVEGRSFDASRSGATLLTTTAASPIRFLFFIILKLIACCSLVGAGVALVFKAHSNR